MDETRTISQIVKSKNKLMEVSNKDINLKECNLEERINIDESLWDQNTYIGRWKQMAFISDFRTIFVPKQKLFQAKQLCHDYASTAALLSLQIINQAFTTIVNYTNRNIKDKEINESENDTIVEEAFLCSSAASCMTVLGLKKMFVCKGPIFTRLIPLGGLTIGNLVNFAVIRRKEISKGIPIWVVHEDHLMNSKVAAIKAASECFFTRTLTVTPTMIMIPIAAEYIKATCLYYRRPWILFPIKLSLCLVSLLVMIPSALALFPLCNSMRPDLMKIYPLEYNEFKEKIEKEELPDRVYYKKGL
ncbi:PREDICTED: sideroflexin-1-like [Polistes dominula]|uniref:Sideroflexin-1-like n=1 Tax=Polistes dominula TaxID=743375 RepID=A0ABM1I2U4_POLDO|nr:PREDICTED: sideroflexin-1-like [Polistes dominula]